jgi:penicillin-binding protein 1A
MSDNTDLPRIPRLHALEQEHASAPEPEHTPIIAPSSVREDTEQSLRQLRKKPRRKSRLARLFFWLLSLGMTGLLVGCVAAYLLFQHFSKELPDSSSLADYRPAGTTRLYAKDGSLIAEYAKERRIYTPYHEIPKRVIHAFVAAEDQNFYSHKGVDPEGILRALLSNLRHYTGQEKSLVGGSTITQQVVKNFLLTREKSYTRKIKEAILALRITQTYSKDRILELYLNEIYLGMGAYGVAAAASEFFDKELAALTTEEAATLAAMPKAPAYYDPRKNPKAALERRNYVINRMAEDGYLNKAEYERAINSPLEVKDARANDFPPSFFAEEVRRTLLQKFGYDTLYKGSLFVRTTLDPKAQALLEASLRHALISYDRRHGYRGALATLADIETWQETLTTLRDVVPLYEEQHLAIVTELTANAATIRVLPQEEVEEINPPTTIIPMREMTWARRVQPSGASGATPRTPKDVLNVGDVVIVSPVDAKGTIVRSSREWRLEQIPAVNGAMVAMRPQTGEIIAMSGGYTIRGNQFNRATQAKRQPGSAFKPFVYLSAFERGFTPSSIVVDAPIELSQGAGLPAWRPKNYDGKFLGAVTLRTGLEKSRNVMTVRLSQMIGLKSVINLSKRLGIYDNVPFNYSTILGAHETTLTRLMGAYAMLGNGGMRVQPTFIQYVANNKGEPLLQAQDVTCTACPKDVVSHNNILTPPTLTDKRERTIDPRVAYQMVNVLRGVIQSGTAMSAKVLEMDIAGKTGTTNDSRDAWFIGLSSDLVVGCYIGYDQPKDMGAKETGGRVALPAFIEFMRDYYGEQKPLAFVAPEGVLEIAVDKYTGVPPMPWQQAGALVKEAFVTGAPIFIPEAEMPKSVAETEDDATTDSDAVINIEDSAPQTQDYQSPEGYGIYRNPIGGNSPPQSYRPSAPLYNPTAPVAPPPSSPPSNNLDSGQQRNYTPPSARNLPSHHPSRQHERRLRPVSPSNSNTDGLY